MQITRYYWNKKRMERKSERTWSKRTIIVRKPGKNRFCLDARKLNNLTVKYAYALQNIVGILSRIDETHFMSSVDLKYAFWKIELEENSKPLSIYSAGPAIVSVQGHALWTVHRGPA